jgi:hypothetical protein
VSVLDNDMTTGEALDAWRDATRAAQLSERLAATAAEASVHVDEDARAVEVIASMAEAAAAAVVAAAASAQVAAERTRQLRTDNRD